MFDFTIREKLLLAAALIVPAALAVWAALIAADYITTNPGDPLAKAGGLNPAQERAVDTNQ